MNELKELMGDAYKEGITVEEISNFFTGKKIADLSTGKYVDKAKFDNTVTDLNQKLNDANKQLNDKLTDEEKVIKEQQAKDAEIQRLTQLLSANTINGNKNTVIGILTSTRETLGVDVGDKDFTKFVENITTEDGSKSTEIANYISTIVKNAYEKGKQDGTKNTMGEFGGGFGQQNGNSGKQDDIGGLGAELANLHINKNKNTYNYFEKK